MNKLIKIMAYDMGIRPYDGEPEGSYGFRIIYSALGIWCLESALCERGGEKGISKNAQSILLHNLAEQYSDLCPDSREKLFGYRKSDIAVFIRNLYEQAGYLLTLENNYNVLNKSGETVELSEDDYLYLGLPPWGFSIQGLGIHSKNNGNSIDLSDFLIRDSLNVEQYIAVNYDDCDFEQKEININELEFFNPCYYGKASNAWCRHMPTNMTMARRSINGPYYRVKRDEDGILIFADEYSSGDIDSLTGAEFRRLYVALKHYYDNPMQILVCPINERYTHIKVLGQLPNREYYYLLLNAWPKNDFADRYNFIISNKLTAQVSTVLEKVGFSIRKGEFYG